MCQADFKVLYMDELPQFSGPLDEVGSDFSS